LDLRRIPEAVLRYPCLNFANARSYAEDAIDDPRNTVHSAIAAGRLLSDALREIRDAKPLFDSEHGPIHAFNGHLRNLPEDFAGACFRRFQWAHFASGGAGGGMRRPNRISLPAECGSRMPSRPSVRRSYGFCGGTRSWPRAV
jgi:hypothetical protein